MNNYSKKTWFRVIALLIVGVFLFQPSAFALKVQKSQTGWIDRKSAWTGGGKQVAIMVGTWLVLKGAGKLIGALKGGGGRASWASRLWWCWRLSYYSCSS